MSSKQGSSNNQDQGNLKKTLQEIEVKRNQVENEDQRAFQDLHQYADLSQLSIIQNKTPQQQQERLNIQPDNIEMVLAHNQIIESGQQNKHIEFLDDFVDFIDKQFNEVKRSSSIYKYYLKIIFQILVYISTIIELILTILYGYVNNILEQEDYARLYYFSILLNIFFHICVWIYTYKYMNVQRHHVCWDLLNCGYYAIIGILSYLKLLPFLMFYTRETSNQQFSFSQINKYLITIKEEKQGNPSRLFKKRNKPVNIFRDLIFHHIALISMSITFLTQTIPMLMIQGLFNSYFEGWDYFNTLTYCFLIINVLCFVSEIQYCSSTFQFREIYVEIADTEVQWQKVSIYSPASTESLCKVDESYLEYTQSLYFYVYTGKLNSQEKRRCMIEIIKFILKFRYLKRIYIAYSDSYELATLQYLANALQFIEIEEFILAYENSDRVQDLKNTFQNLKKYQMVQGENTIYLKMQPKNHNEQTYDQIKRKTIEVNTKRTSSIIGQITGHRNRQISKFFNFMISNDFEALNRQLSKGSQEHRENLQRLCTQKEDLQQIRSSNDKIIMDITKLVILKEQLGFLGIIAYLYQYYDKIKQKILEKIEVINKNLLSNNYSLIAKMLLRFTFLTIQIIYLIEAEKDGLIWTIIILEILSAIFIILPFVKILFSQKESCCDWQSFIILFLLSIFKIMDLFVSYIENSNQGTGGQFEIRFISYIRFKSYIAKFKGNIGDLVLYYPEVPQKIEVFERAGYSEIKWLANISDSFYKIPLFFIYILTTNKDYAWGFSFVNTIKDAVFGMKDLLEVVFQNFFVPALILRKVSIDQFYKSMCCFSPIQKSILLEFPKSFAIVSKLHSTYLNSRKYKIDFTKLDYSQFKPKKKEKLLAKLKLVLVNINSSIEIQKAQELLYMGEEVILIFKCLQVSELQQLRLNFQLDEIASENLQLLNVILSYCPKNNLQQLEIHVETKKAIYLKFNVERKNILTSFYFSYYQIREMRRQYKVQNAETIQINKTFLQLDRYDFQQFYFEVGGFMDLTDCSTFFNQFTEVQTLEIALQSDSVDQSFSLEQNIKTTKITKLSLNLENIYLNTLGVSLQKLEVFKLTLINCRFDKKDLLRLLLTMNNNGRIIVNLRQQTHKDFRFNKQEMQNLQERLSNNQVEINFLF
ncbi:unnamed protein product [Paramecium sonneborni]|uniref:Transmembrane protein n=1 Tax=Paramecium sonneborni TaxID=65129 RepID=A0A8S1PZ23_9CILI|nr:unnamed protein product [Paramecium sonneborni]